MSFKEYASKEYVDELYLKKEDLRSTIHNYLIFKDKSTDYTYYAYIEDGKWTISCKIIEIKVTKLPDKMSYTQGELLDTTGMVVTAVLENSDEVIIDDYNKDIIPILDSTLEIPYVDEFGNEFTIVIEGFEVKEFNPTIELIDFEYTANADGTYTLTGWKQTLNGEPSTEMIVPNNNLIIV